MPETPKKPVKIAPPTGTRDFYPREMLMRRYITDAWRRTALRHGFDEIDGPTFESAELYKVKSGEGILNEMFGVFSGKAESGRRESEPRPSGSEAGSLGAGSGAEEALPHGRGSVDPRNPPFGLRPEFTPTLARMYAARAKQLPQPTKWFCVSNFFRAERPQRGRLREFWQWNCDYIGGEDAAGGDTDVIGCSVDLLGDVGLTFSQVQVRFSQREFLTRLLLAGGTIDERLDEAFQLLDRRERMSREDFGHLGESLGMAPELMLGIEKLCQARFTLDAVRASRWAKDFGIDHIDVPSFDSFLASAEQGNLQDWLRFDLRVVRGLAYYTGTVFEVIAEGERAVAGGGRYDNLIELFGGPPTPACGFGMGDAVLGNLLEDRKLIPEGREMLEALSRPMPLRPDVFVIASPNPGCEEQIVPTVARLRRGEESEKFKQGECKPWSVERHSVPPLHARRSYKATKNVGKLLADAGACHARFAAIIESPETCTLKNLDSGQQTSVALADLAKHL